MTLPFFTVQRTCTFGACGTLIAIAFVALFITQKQDAIVHYPEAIDAVSVQVPTDDIDLQVSALINDQWTEWHTFEMEKEFDPTLQESNLVIFPQKTNALKFKGSQADYAIHPLRTNNAPASYLVADVSINSRTPRILSRSQWGADDSYLFTGETNTRSDEGEAVELDSSARVKECDDMKLKYPQEFRTTKTVEKDAKGRVYRWPKRYSYSISHLVVHHTAQPLAGETRTGWERMRLLYQFHANSRGWGDIGYNYVIDENGQIYEGRDGGKYVVGGHAYCSNIGTLGIALIGHFDKEQPTQSQMKSLQWLLAKLGDDYSIDLHTPTNYHGKVMEPIIGHKDVTSTSCPGFYVRETLDQIQKNVRLGRITTAIRFPAGPGAGALESDLGVAWYSNRKGATIASVGSTDIRGRPGSFLNMSILVKAGDFRLGSRERIADVLRSDSRIGVWQQLGSGKELRVRKEILLPEQLNAGHTARIQLRLQIPREAGIYTLRIGSVAYVITADGRAIGSSKTEAISRIQAPASVGVSQKRLSLIRTPSVSARPSRRVVQEAWEPDRQSIRIKLSHSQQTMIVNVPRNGSSVDGNPTTQSRIDLHMKGDKCIASSFGRLLGEGNPRIESSGDSITITSWETSSNKFRGILECQVEDGNLILINELPLETYMAGLAEEPDSEPYEKQRAFAIAARSYAAHYMSPNNRKFPGKPYDGNDSPASFQKYGGVLFEEKNPRWVDAVKSTDSIVVKKDGYIVKTPYFSTDSGRTKSPNEAGWGRFPFEEVFQSKEDPWCIGQQERGHGVGMSGCGAKGQALEGKTAEQILMYYYPTTKLERF